MIQSVEINEKNKEQDRIGEETGSDVMNRRKALAVLGATGVAMIAGMAEANAGVMYGHEGPLSVQFYENIASMQRDRRLKKGSIAVTIGYYSLGDGGGNMYRITGPSKDLIPDSGSSVVLDNGLWAMLTESTFVNYKMFGAAEDPEKDDGPNIRAAHDYANKHNIPVINLSGEYWIKETNGIVIQTNIQWGHSIFHLDERYNSRHISRFAVQSREAHSEIELNPEVKSRLLKQIKPGVKIVSELAAYKNSLVFISDKNDRIGYRAGGSYKGQSHILQIVAVYMFEVI